MKIYTYIRCKFHIRRHKEVFISPRGCNERKKKKAESNMATLEWQMLTNIAMSLPLYLGLPVLRLIELDEIQFCFLFFCFVFFSRYLPRFWCGFRISFLIKTFVEVCHFCRVGVLVFLLIYVLFTYIYRSIYR